MKNPPLILFDLDGTLTDSGPGIMACVAYAFEKSGREVPPENVLRSFIGPPLRHQFMLEGGMSESEAVQALADYRERYHGTGMFENAVYPGIQEMLQALRDKGFLIGVTSAKPHHYVKMILAHFGLLDCFDVVEGSRTDTENPNKVEVIARTLSRIGYEDKKALVSLVGDRKYDAAGARLSGIGFYGAGWGYAAEGELEAEGAAGIARDPAELVRMILEDAGIGEKM